MDRSIIHEISPLMGKDVLYIADRRKKEFTYPIHNHQVYELNFVEHAAGVRRVVGDSSEVIGDFDVISGDDSLTFPMVSCGAVGVISVIGNAIPKEFSKMIRLQMRGEYDPARKIHHRFTDLFSLLFVDGNPAGVKAMLSEMGFIQNVLRLPLVPMQIKNVQRMSEILKELKY